MSATPKNAMTLSQRLVGLGSMGMELLRPDRKDETYRNGNLGDVRASGSNRSTRLSKANSTSNSGVSGAPAGHSITGRAAEITTNR